MMKSMLFAMALMSALTLCAEDPMPAVRLMDAKAAEAAVGAPVKSDFKWMTDFEAAAALAKKTNRPIFLHFTGSDWCGWCKLMEKNVFSQDAWKAYATDAIVPVIADFPRDKAKLASGQLEKNNALAKKFGVRGYPTYVVLSSDGKELGRLGADRQATPASFITQLREVLILDRMDKLLSAEDFKAYTELKTKEAAALKEYYAWQEGLRKAAEAFEKRLTSLNEQVKALQKKALDASEK